MLVVPARSTDEKRFAIIATLNGKVWLAERLKAEQAEATQGRYNRKEG